MKWNTLLLIISFSMLLFYAGGYYMGPFMAAEAIAEQLAPRIGVQEDILRGNLRDILEGNRLPRTIVDCTPWAILSLLLTVRILIDVVKKQKDRAV
jgi:hypothetical protein